MARSRKKATPSSYVVASRIREHLKQNGQRMSADLVPALDAAVIFLLDEAAERAAYNGRVTVSAGDL